MQLASSVILSDNTATLFLYCYKIRTFNLYLILCIGYFAYLFYLHIMKLKSIYKNIFCTCGAVLKVTGCIPHVLQT